jgi:hypothetical protein
MLATLGGRQRLSGRSLAKPAPTTYSSRCQWLAGDEAGVGVGVDPIADVGRDIEHVGRDIDSRIRLPSRRFRQRHGELRTDLDLLEVAKWPALTQFIHSGWPAGLLAARRPGHRNLLKTFVLQAFLPLGVTEARVERPLPRACAVVQPAQRADVLARG